MDVDLDESVYSPDLLNAASGHFALTPAQARAVFGKVQATSATWPDIAEVARARPMEIGGTGTPEVS